MRTKRMKSVVRISCLVAGLLFSTIYLVGQCPPGVITLNTQADVDAYFTNYPGCTEPNGLTITGLDITNLDGLSGITSVVGDLTVLGNPNLNNIDGLLLCSNVSGALQFDNNTVLPNLDGLVELFEVGGPVFISNSASLDNLLGLLNLQLVGGSFTLQNLPLVTTLDGLESLTTIGNNLEIFSCTGLNEIVSLSSLTSVQAIWIQNATTLFSLEGLSGISNLGLLSLQNCISLSDLSGLENLTSLGSIEIGNCLELINLNGLNNVQNIGSGSIGTMYIQFNISLEDITALSNVTYVGSNIWIEGNPQLSSIEGIHNVAPTFENLTLIDNGILDMCSFPNICAYLQTGSSNTIDNSPQFNCTDAIEVLQFCNLDCQDPSPDYQALLDFFTATAGPNWNQNEGWIEGLGEQSCDPCNYNGNPWFGVTCINGRVSRIDLNNNGLNGVIPEGLQQVNFLQELNLANNNLSGTLPISIGNLSFLEDLNLADNNLIGQVPSSWNNLISLQNLNLANNSLNGAFLQEISNFNSLRTLRINGNNFDGMIPEEISTLNNLQTIDAYGNEFVGTIPDGLGNIPSLTSIDFSNNTLSGCYPNNFIDLCATATLNFFNNGALPWGGDILPFCEGQDQIGAPCIVDGNALSIQSDCACAISSGPMCNPVGDSIRLVQVFNALDGPAWTYDALLYQDYLLFQMLDVPNATNPWNQGTPISTWHGIETNAEGCVTKIVLNSNNLTGELPSLSFSHLEEIHLDQNDVQGAIPSLDSLPRLISFAASGNALNSSIPILDSLVNLQALVLSSNALTGELPALDSLRQLVIFSVANNAIGGPIPSLANLTNLESFNSSVNQLDGPFPDISMNTALLSFNISENQITGTIPDLSSNAQLEFFVIFSNGITGTIPALDALQNLIFFSAFNNQLEGSIPNLQSLLSLQEFYCDFNQMTGSIPELSGMNELLIFRCANNQLTGEIPALTNVASLVDFQCYSNDLSGCLPSFACDISIFDATNNPQLPWQGDHIPFCNGESEVGAPCQDGDMNTGNDQIQEDCSCQGIVETCVQRDYRALRSLYLATDGDNWINKDGWPDESTFEMFPDFIPAGFENLEEWYGVTTNVDGCVIAIDLDGTDNLSFLLIEGVNQEGGNNLNGSLPSFDEGLTFLNFLSLSGNLLTGPIPNNVGNLQRLVQLNMGDNQLNGLIPNSLYDIEPLAVIMLPNNQLEGDLSRLPQLTNLINLFLGDNQMSGLVPNEICNLNLQQLELDRNNFSGAFPPCVFQMSELIDLIIYENSFTGNIPSLEAMPNLLYFGVSNNQFSGPLPIMNTNTALRFCNLSNNGFTGIIPDIDNLGDLETYLCVNNQLSGCFPNFACQIETFNSNANTMLPWQGDHIPFCNGESTTFAPCENNQEQSYIDQNCDCQPCVPEPVVINQTLCSYESINVNNTVYDIDTPSGVETLTAITGCDSIIQIELSFYPAIDTSFVDTLVCDQTSINFQGVEIFPGDPIMFFVDQSINGCDSLIGLTANFINVGDACDDGDPITQNDVVQADCSCAGCMPTGSVIDMVLCPEESIEVNNVVYDRNNPIGQEVLLNQNGCDSIIDIALNFYTEPEIIELDSTVCNLSNLTISNVLFTPIENSQFIEWETLNGCDSLVSWTVFFQNTGDACDDGNENTDNETLDENCECLGCTPSSFVIDGTFCPDEEILVNGTVYNLSNPEGEETLINQLGCDSTISISMNFFESIPPTELTPMLCDGDTIVIDGNEVTSNTLSWEYALLNANGCDSTILINAVLLENTSSSFTASVCQGDSIVVHGDIYSESNPSGQTIIPNLQGCDSIINVSIDIIQESIFILDTILCNVESFFKGGLMFSPEDTVGIISYMTSGQISCDSSVVVNASFLFTGDPCDDGNPDTVNDVLDIDCNCRGQETDCEMALTDDEAIAGVGDYIEVDIFSNDIVPFNSTWRIAKVSEVVFQDPEMDAKTGEFSATIIEQFGDTLYLDYEVCNINCETCDQATLRIANSVFKDITLVTAFSPDGDGINDMLTFSDEDQMENASLTIYNRWGDRVYTSEEYENNWEARGLPGGVYYYILELEGAVVKRSLTIFK